MTPFSPSDHAYKKEDVMGLIIGYQHDQDTRVPNDQAPRKSLSTCLIIGSLVADRT